MGCGASASLEGPSKAAERLGKMSDGSVHTTDIVKSPQTDAMDDNTISTTASSRSATPLLQPSAVAVDSLPTWPCKMFVDAPDHGFMIFRVFAFLPWSQRGDALCLSRGMRNFFNSDDVHGEFWRWHCECLCAEAHLFLPDADSAPKCDGRLALAVDYHALLAELWPFRSRFADQVGAETAPGGNESFRVSVFCRMRPTPPAALCGGGIFDEMLSAPVTLPLGQRVALVRQRHPEMTRAEAMRTLLNSKCGAAAPLDEDDDELTLLRQEEAANARPQTSLQPSGIEDAASSSGTGFNASVLSVTSGKAGSVLTVSPGIGIRKWGFANVFGDGSTQRQLYGTCGHRLSTNLMNGQSGSIIVYGQTGSGKTHTMFGGPQSRDGLVPSLADDVLQAVDTRRAAGFNCQVGASIVEVFGSDVNNLLGKTGSEKLSATMGTKHILDGKYAHPVTDRASFVSLLNLGEERKRKAATEMNERSTRAHTMVILRLRQRAPGQTKVVESVLSLVDLGGSERVSKSKANENCKAAGAVNTGDGEVARVTWGEYYKSRERITETNNINKGLLALKRCVQALNERQKRAEEGRPLVRVPYTDSKLTMLLQPSLSGEANTSIVVCCSPEDRHAEETVQSLRFGEMCSSVENMRADTSATDAGAAVAEAISQIDADIKEVETAIRAKEKWEWRTTIKTDIIDEMDTGGTACNKEEAMELGGLGAVEIAADDGASKKRTVEHEVRSQVLVGAEAENLRRDELIKTRLKLLGGDE